MTNTGRLSSASVCFKCARQTPAQVGSCARGELIAAMIQSPLKTRVSPLAAIGRGRESLQVAPGTPLQVPEGRDLLYRPRRQWPVMRAKSGAGKGAIRSCPPISEPVRWHVALAGIHGSASGEAELKALAGIDQ